MATLAVTNPTLLDLARVTDPDGSIAAVVEILNETNEILADMTWVEGNLPTGHRSTTRTGIPTPTWRKLYGGVQPNKSTTVQVTDNTGMLEAYAEVDKALADLNGNTAAFRLQEDRPHIEGMNQEIVDTLFYGDEATEPEAFTGLSARFANLTADANSDNVINGGGSGSDNASIWLVVWGPNTVHGIIPKGSTAGLQVEDKGQVTLEDASDASNTGRMEAYRTHYRWDAGLTVRDWRYVVRISNIDKSALSTVFNSGVFNSPSAHLPDLMFQAMRLVPNLSAGRPAFYMSRDTMTNVMQQAAAATVGSTLMSENVGGKIVTSMHGIPMRRCDSLSADEAALT
jgi:hypothetical protein